MQKLSSNPPMWLNCFLIYHSPREIAQQEVNGLDVIAGIIGYLLENKFVTVLIIPGYMLEAFRKYRPESLELINEGLRQKIFSLADTTYDFIFLPFFGSSVIRDQIEKQRDIMEKVFPEANDVHLFYPPVQAVDQRVVDELIGLGFNRILVDELIHEDHIGIRNSESFLYKESQLVTTSRVFENIILHSDLLDDANRYEDFITEHGLNQLVTISNIYHYEFARPVIEELRSKGSSRMVNSLDGVKSGNFPSITTIRPCLAMGASYNPKNPYFSIRDETSLLVGKIDQFCQVGLKYEPLGLAQFMDVYHHFLINADHANILWMLYSVYENTGRKILDNDKKNEWQTMYEDLIFSYLDYIHSDDRDRNLLDEVLPYIQKLVPELNLLSAEELGELRAKEYRGILN